MPAKVTQETCLLTTTVIPTAWYLASSWPKSAVALKALLLVSYQRYVGGLAERDKNVTRLALPIRKVDCDPTHIHQC